MEAQKLGRARSLWRLTRSSNRKAPATVTDPPAESISQLRRKMALQREATELSTKKSYGSTGVKRGEPTPLYAEWMARPELKVMPKLQKEHMPTRTELHARVAALARWNKAKRAGGGAVEPVPNEVARLLPAADESRHWRRGESTYFVGSMRDYQPAELVFWCRAITERQVKYTELKELYESGRIRVPSGTVGRFTTGKQKDEWKKYETVGFTPLGAPPRVRLPRTPCPPATHTHSPTPPSVCTSGTDSFARGIRHGTCRSSRSPAKACRQE